MNITGATGLTPRPKRDSLVGWSFPGKKALLPHYLCIVDIEVKKGVVMPDQAQAVSVSLEGISGYGKSYILSKLRETLSIIASTFFECFQSSSNPRVFQVSEALQIYHQRVTTPD
jgi:hypothetical protein